MSEIICQTIQVHKGSRLCDVNLKIRRGEIFGLIGENGAGKTTLMKILTGLVTPSLGQVELFGESSPQGLMRGRTKVGCIVESPALNQDMTAYQNLNIHRIQKGIPGVDCITEVLSLVNLTDVEKKKVKHFSLGMKQRLGLAIALLGNPELLILDEPINGLDPTGIIEFRDILIKLNKEYGTTIIISSHILSELHKLASSFGIIHKGKLLQQITSKKLDERCQKHIHLSVEQPQAVVCLLENVLGIKKYEVLPQNIIKIYEALNQTRQINKLLADNAIYADEITVKGDSLESYFSRVIGGNEHV